MWLLTMTLGLQEATATTYAEILDLQELTDRSSKVVTGTVASAESYAWEGLIWTMVTVEVEDGLVGATGQTVSFDIPGGQLDGLNLTVPGAPQFEDGQEVLVFLEGGSLVGFGQGAFSIRSGVAGRGLGPIIPDGPQDFDINQRLPNRDDSSSCLQPKLWQDYADEWNLRGVAHLVSSNGEIEARSLHLIAGLEYRLQICGDSHLGGAQLYIADRQGKVVVESTDEGREGILHFIPPVSGEYLLGIAAKDIPADAVGSSISVSIAYR